MSKKKELRQVEQPPILDEEDEKILDEIWDSIGKENDGKQRESDSFRPTGKQ